MVDRSGGIAAKWMFILKMIIWIAVAICSVGVFAVSLSLRYSSAEDPSESMFHLILDLIHGVASFGIAILIYWKKVRSTFAWFASAALMATGTVTTIGTVQAQYPSMDWLFSSLIFISAGYLVFFYLFPNGRFVPRWTRYAAYLWIVFSVGRTLFKGSFLDPFTWPPIWNFSGWVAFHAVALIAQVIRYRSFSSKEERQQTKWFLYGLASMVAALIFESILENTQHFFAPGAADTALRMVAETIAALGAVMVPISIGVAMQRYRLWDIDYLINRTLVYSILSACVIGIYVLTVGTIGVLFQSLSIGGNFLSSLLAAGLIAVLVHPIRHYLQRIIDRMMYGKRNHPYEVISHLGQRLAASLAPQEILPATVETLAVALKLPYVAVSIKESSDHIAASYGNRVDPVLPIPLIYQSEIVGELLLSSRSPNEEFPAHERKMLSELARQVGVAVHNVQLTADLRQARERLVTAREEERRRLRRDLHDTMGPELASLSMLTAAAQNMLPDRPDEVKSLLKQMNQKLQETIHDIRQIVYALRPPILDELGLMFALHKQVEQVSGEVHFVLDGPDSLPALPAAVEVAAYRIIQEAITNVVRHSKARNCRIKIRLEGDFFLEVSDDGIGISTRREGVGLHSMKERAEELGGSFKIYDQSGGGTVVSARLPISKGEV